MKNYLRKEIKVPLENLYPDPNNPRLALPGAPGYTDGKRLFDADLRKEIFAEIGEEAYAVDTLMQAIVGQGWMPIDAIIVWRHPDDGDRWVVLEGNRRRIALEKVHSIEFQKAKKKLERMKSGAASKTQLQEQQRHIDHLEQIVADTRELSVIPIAADSVEELQQKLPRVLAVRHITGAKEWGNYAEDLWLLKRYKHLFEDKHGSDATVFWDAGIIEGLADEASLGKTNVKRQLRSASWFAHFRNEWEGELPEGEKFRKTDYYLFENVSKKPWLRQKFGIGNDDTEISPESEQVIFKWLFRHPRGRTADDNPNVFYRHENVLLWDKMKRYDDQHGTSFAARFDVDNPDDAPTMHEVEADWLGHKARRTPHAVLDELLRQLSELTAEHLADGGEHLQTQLERLREQSGKFLRMIHAAETV